MAWPWTRATQHPAAVEEPAGALVLIPMEQWQWAMCLLASAMLLPILSRSPTTDAQLSRAQRLRCVVLTLALRLCLQDATRPCKLQGQTRPYLRRIFRVRFIVLARLLLLPSQKPRHPHTRHPPSRALAGSLASCLTHKAPKGNAMNPVEWFLVWWLLVVSVIACFLYFLCGQHWACGSKRICQAWQSRDHCCPH
jgi:hypothetical protein